jgi:hypothetical protein
MGLLDEAIREHLELKRRHGADPGEIARQEREALGPARRDAPDTADALAEQPDNGTPPEAEAEVEVEVETVAEPGLPGEEPELEQATAEYSVEDEVEEEDELEWEEAAPADADATEGTEDPEDPEGDADEDVLEETPEFLQETPEHDRLWFEQKPPKDFDF